MYSLLRRVEFAVGGNNAPYNSEFAVPHIGYSCSHSLYGVLKSLPIRGAGKTVAM